LVLSIEAMELRVVVEADDPFFVLDIDGIFLYDP
jgi:hypothetical protein